MKARSACPVPGICIHSFYAAVCAALLTGLLALGGCTTSSNQAKNRPEVVSGLVNLGPARNFPAGTANTSYLGRYGIVLVNQSGQVVAIRPQCSDAGCLAHWEPDHRRFVCPCDGSQFDLLGRPLKGPARQPLPAVATHENSDGTLSVDLGQLYALPGAHLPSQPD